MSGTSEISLKARRSRGNRRQEILQTLARMLEQEDFEKITTARLAAALDVSEAALYRNFKNKSAMFGALIDFAEESLLGLAGQIQSRKDLDGVAQAKALSDVMLEFAEANRGITRLLTGQALVFEDPRLTARITQLSAKLELCLKQCFREAILTGKLPADFNASGRAAAVMNCVMGSWVRFVLSGFKARPMLAGTAAFAPLFAA
ncbi:MAG: HTH tetR-type domain-containing protein [Burkholderia sp.]|jgi:TetR/AcrR family transcriptional regulator